MKTKYISKFVMDFIETNKSKQDKIKDNWNSDENMKALKKLLLKNRVVDKNKPKRAKSAYLYFCDDYRQVVKDEMPHLDNRQVIGELGIRWHKMKEQNPKKIVEYEKKSEIDRDEYKKAMNNYKKGNEESEQEDNSIEEKKKEKEEKKKEKEEKKKEKEEKKKEKEEKKIKKDDDNKEKKEEEKVVKEHRKIKKSPRKKEQKIMEEDKEIDEIKKILKEDEDSVSKDEIGFQKYFDKKNKKTKKEHPELDSDEILKKLKKKWKKLSDEKKEKYF
jgi:flagellar biosynthesis GTPase FlhF